MAFSLCLVAVLSLASARDYPKRSVVDEALVKGVSNRAQRHEALDEMAWLSRGHEDRYSTERFPENTMSNKLMKDLKGSDSKTLETAPVKPKALHRTASRTPLKAAAEVYTDLPISENKEANEATMELLRFTTAYGQGLDSFVDVTPYAPLFQDWAGNLCECHESKDADKDSGGLCRCDALHLYGAIDTWIGNTSGSTSYYIKNKKLEEAFEQADGKNVTYTLDDRIDRSNCQAVSRPPKYMGWALSADLVFIDNMDEGEASKRRTDFKPKEVLSLASGYYSTYGIGGISMHHGTMHANGTLMLDERVDLTGVTEAVAYDCEDGESVVKRNVMSDYIAKRAEDEALTGTEESMADARAEFTEYFMGDQLGLLVPIHGKSDGDVFQAKFGGDMSPEEKMNVYYANVFTENILQDADGGAHLWNMSYPFVPVGQILSVDQESKTVKVHVTASCVPVDFAGLKFQVARRTGMEQEVSEFVDSAMGYGQMSAKANAGKPRPTEQQRFTLPASDIIGHLDLPHALGLYTEKHGAVVDAIPLQIDGSPVTAESFNLADTSDAKKMRDTTADVCAVLKRQHGRVLERKFDIPQVTPTDRVLARIAVTGHGWEYTQDQCGEYCNVKYQLRFNGGDPIELTQWRDDCKENPIGKEIPNYGTWYESRNGWCPGAVEPGAMVDVTDQLKLIDNAKEQTATLDILVYDPNSEVYEPFTNIKGWVYGDGSILKVSLSLHVYEKEISQNVKDRNECSIAENAMKMSLRMGPTVAGLYARSLGEKSMPTEQEKPVYALNRKWNSNFDSRTNETEKYQWHDCFDFGKRGETGRWEPHTWSLVDYPEGKMTLQNLVDRGKATIIPVIKRQLMDKNTRYHSVPVRLHGMPPKYSQVGLRFRLEKPEGMDFDPWDRVGSVGLAFGPDSHIAGIHEGFARNFKKAEIGHAAEQSGASGLGVYSVAATLCALISSMFTFL